MTKDITFHPRPSKPRPNLPPAPEHWVERRQGTRKLTLRLPADLHMAFKGRCVAEGVSLQDKTRDLIEAFIAPPPAIGSSAPRKPER